MLYERQALGFKALWSYKGSGGKAGNKLQLFQVCRVEKTI